MSRCHNVLLLLDTAGAAAKSRVQLLALRLLNHLSCGSGLPRVRWGFQFFDSQGARSRPSRVSDFRELGPSSWEDFEEELEARFGDRAQRPHLPGPATRATHIQNVLTETLLDYQWDRPDISSPAKPVLRSSRRRWLGPHEEPGGADADLRGVENAVFLFSPCPHSQRELLQFVAGSDAHGQHLLATPQGVLEKLLPKRVQEILMGRKISLYWVDTTETSKMQDSPDHLGYWTMFELFHRVGGTILPSEILVQCFNQDGEKLSSCERVNADHSPAEPAQPQFSPWISSLPFESTLNCLLCHSPRYKASFPLIEGTLFLPVKGNEPQQTWAVTLEPLTMNQKNFQRPVSVFLNGTVTHWTHPVSSNFGTDSWILQSSGSEKSEQGRLFQQLVRSLTTEELHLVADVVPGEGWPPSTGIISPLSATATILTVFRNEHGELQKNIREGVPENHQEKTYLLPDIVNSVLNQIHNSQENANTSVAIPVPEWAQQELGRTNPWSASIVEKWFPFSNHSGASSNLMESFWLLQATSANKEDSSKTEGELTYFLSEFYQRKSREEFTAVGQEDNKKKRGLPGTPVRQKMKSMSRSLKMLNVARLNVKAQKLQPDCSPSSTGEKIVQKTTFRRTEEKLEERGKMLRSSKPKDFKTEEELLSHLNENYQKTVTMGENLTHTSAQNMILAIKMFLKSKGTKELEMACLDQVKNYLLKTSKDLRQQLRKNLDQEAKVRECQLQVFLRLELCLQCPSIQNSSDDMEHLVEEITDLLRAVCLSEDPAYLSGFLEEILGLYIASIPKTLGNLYYSLGFVIPQKLAVILPADFFSDDSMTQEGTSPTLSVPHTRSMVSVSSESDQLEELRSRSAKKRKHALTRHRSVTEAAQSLRQIEVPKRATKKENFHPGHQQPPLSVKDSAQEVTKVRRNLFSQEMLSPSKRALKRLPRSHSVSAVEGLKYKVDGCKEIQDYHKLLTKRVSETPLHKQVSGRLLQRQIKGRSSDPGPDIDVVEESPEKEESETNLRRSPRIKNLSFSRTNSASFYPISQPKSRNIQRVCLKQKNESGTKQCTTVQSIQSPKRLLFGAVSDLSTPTKELLQTKKSPRNSLQFENPIFYQTPQKSDQHPRTPTHRILRRSPPTPQMVYHTPRKQRKPTSKNTSIDQMVFKSPTKDFSSTLEVTSPSGAKVVSQKGSPLEKELTPPLKKMGLRTPKRQRSQTPELLETPPWSLQRNASVSCPEAQATFTIQTSVANCQTPIKHSQKTPQKSATCAPPRTPHQEAAVTPLSQKNQDPSVLMHTASQPMEYIKEMKDETAHNFKGSGSIVAAFTPPISSPKKKLLDSPCGASIKTPTRSFVDSPSSPGLGEFNWRVPEKSPNRTVTPLTCNLISTPRKSPRVAKPGNGLPPPPSKTRKQRLNRNNSIKRHQPLCQSSTPDTTAEQGYMAAMDLSPKKEQEKISSPVSPKEHFLSSPGGGFEWCDFSPLLTDQNATEQQSSDNSEACVSPAKGSQPSPSSGALSLPTRPTSPLASSYALRRTADRRQRQAAAHRGDPRGFPLPSKDSPRVVTVSPPTYEVELEMQASGLPKLRIKRVDSTSVSTENQKEVETPLGGENFPDVGSSLHQGKPGQLEAVYVSSPCLRSSRNTPGKSGGQMYICQSYTPTHCPSSTTSPSPTGVWVPWTPSPRHKGKTTPDTIQDWPRKKKAVDSSIYSCGGRNERGLDLLGNVSGIEEVGKERVFEQCISKTSVSGDFELEGICQLPDQSPSSDYEPRTEDSLTKGQFGLFSRKRPFSSKEETDQQAKRSCGSHKGNQVIFADNETREERKSPVRSTKPPSSLGDDEVFLSGSTPPNCAVRNCLSASGLRALTQSPLLYQGKAPSFQRKDIRDEEMDIFPSTEDQESPFNIAISRRHPLNRTYTRKKLLS